MTDEVWISRLSSGEGELDEQELQRRYLQRLTDWLEPGAVKVYRDGKLLGPLIMPNRVELRKRILRLP